MHRILIFILPIVICFNNSTTLHAQRPLPDANQLKWGYLLYGNYSFYQWFQKPTAIRPTFRTSGQVLNVLPGIGTGFWLGKPYKWWLSLEAGIEYAPFTLDVDKFKGMGSLAIPVFFKATVPVARQHSTIIALNFGAGVQLSKAEIYAIPDEFAAVNNPFFITYALEAAIMLGAVDENLKKMRDLSLFMRYGIGVEGAMSINCGLRLTFWNGI